LCVSVQIAFHADLSKKVESQSANDRNISSTIKKGIMDTEQNPNEPSKPTAPGQGEQDREREERERQRREREKQGGGQPGGGQQGGG
jgi:hypothetical protein